MNITTAAMEVLERVESQEDAALKEAFQSAIGCLVRTLELYGYVAAGLFSLRKGRILPGQYQLHTLYLSRLLLLLLIVSGAPKGCSAGQTVWL